MNNDEGQPMSKHTTTTTTDAPRVHLLTRMVIEKVKTYNASYAMAGINVAQDIIDSQWKQPPSAWCTALMVDIDLAVQAARDQLARR